MLKHKPAMLLSIGLSLLFTNHGFSQSVTGFWGVEEVVVGDRVVTPVAKWFKNNPDGTFTAGNGWLQNAHGTWTFDPETNQYKPTNSDGLLDEFGPFTVKFPGDKMTWEREEDGMHVMVTLSRIDEMPMGPADKIKGLWDLVSVTKDGQDITATVDPDNNQYYFVRWDRLFNMRKADGSRTHGFWHMDGHEPKFFLINFDKAIPDEVYMVSFDKDRLIMNREGDEGLVYVCRRLTEFPQ